MKKPKTPPKPWEPPQQKKTEFETFLLVDSWVIGNMTRPMTACNGHIRIQKCKVTVEPIDEPKEVLIERLLKLFHETPHNIHLMEPFRRWAKYLGIELEWNDMGKNLK